MFESPAGTNRSESIDRKPTVMEMPISDLSGDTESIDWCETQPDGVYRCVNGWQSGGADYGCTNRGILENKDGELWCRPCTQIGALNAISTALINETDAANARAEDYNEYLQDIVNSLGDLAWRTLPLYRRAWRRISHMIRERRQRWQNREHVRQADKLYPVREEPREDI